MGDSPCPQQPVTIEAECVPVLDEALAALAVPVVTRLVLTAERELLGARVTVAVRAAGRPLADPVELRADLLPGRPTVLLDVPLLLDPAAFAALPEASPGEVTVRVGHDDDVLAGTSAPVRVLGAGQWLAAPSPLALELLAAHVRPDDPAVAGLVGAAADHLRQRTGRPELADLDPAHLDPAELDQAAAAIVEAMRRRGIRPLPAAARWADVAQRVRTPTEVLDERAGTGLDTALTLAAAFEHAGLRPLVWITADDAGPAHAFLGWWRGGPGAEHTATTDVAGLAELVADGTIGLVEPALLVAGAPPATFGDLHRTAAASWLTGDHHRLLGVTDVHRARADGVRPLGPKPRAATPLAAALATLPAPQPLDLADALPLTVPAGRLSVLAERLAAGAPLTLLPADQLGAAARRRGIRAARDLPAHQLAELLTEHGGLYTELSSAAYGEQAGALAERAQAVLATRGTNDLCLALGSLTWAPEGRAVRAPLVLLPVTLTAGANGSFRLVADPTGGTTVNAQLLAELRRRHGVSLPLPAEPDPAAVVVALRQALARSGASARVEPTADLALLPAAASRVRQDAEHLGAAALRNPLVPVLLRPGQPFPAQDPAGTDLDQLATTLPLPADGSQLAAVADALAGRTFALLGAAGTGKAQTVANTVAAVAGAGRRVLVVAPRRGTLDTVAARLADAGLSALVTGEQAPELPTSELPDLGPLRKQLAGYSARLHAPNSAGLSLYDASASLVAAGAAIPSLPVPPAFVVNASTRTTAAVRAALAELPAVAARTRPRAGHPWGFLDSADVDPVAVQAAVRAVDRALDAVPPGPVARVVSAAPTPADLSAVAVLLDGPAVPLADLDLAGTPEWEEQVAELRADVAFFCTEQHPGMDVAGPAVLDLPLAAIAENARQAAASGRIGRGKRLAAVLAELTPALLPGAEVPPAEVPALAEELLAVQAAARELGFRARELPGVDLPWNWNPFTDVDRLDAQLEAVRRLAAALRANPDHTPALRRFIDTASLPDPARASAVRALQRALAELPGACLATPEQLLAWAGDRRLVARWEETRAGRAIDEFGLPSLAHWLDLLRALHLLDAAGLTAMRDALVSGAVPAEQAVAAFDRGLAESSVTERAAAAGLTAADARAHEAAVGLFLRASAAARAAAAARVLAGAIPGSCVLATPDEVARRLPPEPGSFDLVVLADAGRLPVADALGALGRATAAVVVGGEQDGLLAACLRAGVPRRELAWHHRSEDELLFAVPNAVHRVGTFPSAVPGPALALVSVDGRFSRTGSAAGTNAAEAAAVVAEVARRFADSPGAAPSVAVVTVHAAQRRLVEELLRAAADPRVVSALDSGDLRVAAVEAVHGGEWDVVLLSLGASPDERGGLPLDLGPLNRAGGERRLRAVVTRARRQLLVFASFPPAALVPAGTAQRGVRELRALLDVVTAGAAAAPRDGVPAPVHDAHREDVAAALRDRGLSVRTDVGLSQFRIDVAVAPADEPGQPRVAVLLDGPDAAVTLGDRLELPVRALAARGWAVERVWLPEWLADRAAVLDRLVTAVQAARPPAALPTPLPAEAARREAPTPAPPAGDAPRRVPARPVVPPVRLPGEEPFVPWTPGPAGEPRDLRRLDDPAIARLVREVLVDGIAAEGPVHRERLARRAARAFEVPRLTDARMAELLALLPEPAAEWLWPEDLDPVSWAGFRRQGSAGDRPLEHVPPEEIGNAMVALLRSSGGLTHEQLVAQTLAVFGHRRLHPVLMPALEAGLARAARAGRVTRSGSGQPITATDAVGAGFFAGA
ncbi:DUF4011 domain-containing protein [Modestobacter roseus]|uniref:AAA domain-containing protein n=1 Tax=Modestobacter roseus TaxID=1181884 RepID=A0A562IRE3_9ACTN|nr:DUF4011 domain-containing protein [Modestobacter roseus]MQA35482.1 DUF4011 domain-containing protein [Modestobacter roseus]TWH73597.1 AAA domain-containing protein [Modestobacter roseus]